MSGTPVRISEDHPPTHITRHMKFIAALLLAFTSASCVLAIGNKGSDDITCCQASERLGIECPECAAMEEEG